MRLSGSQGGALDIEPHRAALAETLERTPGLVAAYLYGSYGTRFQTPLSDVDVGLVFRHDAVPGFCEQVEITATISDVLHTDDVSVTVLNRCAPVFQYRVLSTGRLLRCSDPTALADFVEQVLNKYHDLAGDYERFYQEYDAALVERYRR